MSSVTKLIAEQQADVKLDAALTRSRPVSQKTTRYTDDSGNRVIGASELPMPRQRQKILKGSQGRAAKKRVRQLIKHNAWASKHRCRVCSGTAHVDGAWCHACAATGVYIEPQKTLVAKPVVAKAVTAETQTVAERMRPRLVRRNK